MRLLFELYLFLCSALFCFLIISNPHPFQKFVVETSAKKEVLISVDILETYFGNICHKTKIAVDVNLEKASVIEKI